MTDRTNLSAVKACSKNKRPIEAAVVKPDGPMKPAPDHLTKVLFDTSGDPDVTIFTAAGPTRVDESKLRKQNAQIRIGRLRDGTLIFSLKTED